MFARPDFQASEYSATGDAGQLGKGDSIQPKQLHVYAAALRHVPISVCYVNTCIYMQMVPLQFHITYTVTVQMLSDRELDGGKKLTSPSDPLKLSSHCFCTR